MAGKDNMKISFDQVQAAQRVVANGIDEMQRLARTIFASSNITLTAMQAPAGQIAAGTFDELGGAGRALYEALTDLHNDLGRMAGSAAQGSDEMTGIARTAAGTSGHPVATGM
ncbi:hypothetical protein [uncultured Jatrophihabitans sp.]|uniref:hypothetical protein n=1 Tax=uncultured Jatrophihabitans sp. TaxID=1610747 RepID=UPI0035CC2DC6